ncbi:TIGR03564 family F420-dependent LLM class oxidoreductase [Streptoalloteichus hindustanus]|uniref:F420-dependent oxidoreductase, MSMEG_4879 family n=1 Tax=Streptoalloteichus hindustanus TaxID=2017 RepID=A0A1M5FLR6_STRHI|nr:TIGR03564 family F420-dependent LLM class oxidoreductase [Streptoalloteichus hindustanus]SHF92435.1 F420-dependent oxidoreductase, MSMEG_4879 family [Streptoalloteichus hindustanus]
MAMTVRYGVVLGGSHGNNVVEAMVAEAREAAGYGVDSVWVGQRLDYDAIGVAGVIGARVPGVDVGVSAVPVFGRHPLLVSSQAQTAQAATGGRFHLALALGVPQLVERSFGLAWERPVARLREFLTVLGPLLRGEAVAHEGELITARSALPTRVVGAQPPTPLLVAAMAPRALRVTGELADGTVAFLAGPGALADHIVPTLATAAANAGRPAPRVVALVPAAVTTDEDARRAMADDLAFYRDFSSYQRVLALSGVDDPMDLALLGDEDTVAAGLRRYVEAGATEIVLTGHLGLDPAIQSRTRRLAGALARATASDVVAPH